MECLQSLYLSDPQDDLAAIRSTRGVRVSGTCEWILNQDRYTAFLVEDGPRLLWLSGGPGIGKTMISSFLVEELARLAERSSQMTLAYYFCDDKDEKRRTATAILRGLLLQLLRQRPVLFKHIQPRFDMSRDTLFTNFHSLWRVFVSAVQDPETDDVYCLVDALDECEKESRQLFLTSLASLTNVFGLRQDKKASVKFIITSRRENDIEEELLSADNPYVQDLHIDSGNVNHDLYKFINVRVNQLAAKRKFRSKKTAEELERAVAQKAGGTFLYVSLVLNELRRTPESQIQRKLQEWPSELNGIYDKILSQIEDGCEDMVKSVLRWIVVARRPLAIREIATACVLSSADFKDNTILSDDLDRHENDFEWCRSFVYIDHVNQTINLVHQSAKDYLLGAYLQANEGLSQYHIILDKTNLLIFKLCWMYLSLAEFEQGTKLIDRDIYGCLIRSPLERSLHDHCFVQYANKEWRNHALAAGSALATDHTFWKDDLNKMPTIRDSWLLDAANQGQQLIVQQLLEEGAEPDSQDKHWRTPLSWAAEEGHASIVKLLLSRDDLAADPQDDYRSTPLYFAAVRREEAMIRLLLSRDDVAVNSRDYKGRTPLSYAAEEGHEAVITLLLSRGDVAVDSHDEYGITPLSHAARGGHEAVVRLLLSRDDVIVNSRDGNDRTPLSYAANEGHEAVVRLLSSRDDVAIDSRDERGLTPLSRAAMRGREAIVKLLLSRDDVTADSRNNWGRTPLSWAAERGHEAVVRLLLSRDEVAVNSRDDEGRTPLSYAAETGYKEVVRLLLSRDDVTVDSRNNKSRTPLDWAKSRGHDVVVRLLEQKMEEANSTARERRFEES